MKIPEWAEKTTQPALTNYLRAAFFRSISQVAPEVKDTLNRRSYKLYCDIIENNEDLYSSTISYKDLMQDPQLKPLQESLTVWATTYNLTASWCYERALEALLRMRIGNYDGDDEDWGGLVLSWELFKSVDDMIPPLNGFKSYLPGVQTRNAYLRECKDALQKEEEEKISRSQILSLGSTAILKRFNDSILAKVESYCDKVEKWFSAQGDWQRRYSWPEIESHITWTVKFQVCGLNFSMITRENEATARKKIEAVTTVKRAVEKMLRKIGLEKRTVSPGRPVGRKDSQGHRRRYVRNPPRP